MKKLTLSLLIALISPITQASCTEFFDARAEEMSLGKLTEPKCGVSTENTEAKQRISLSKRAGRKDTGPSLTSYPSEEGVKIVQLNSKDATTKYKLKYTYNFDQNCSQIKDITYQLGTLQSEITYDKCQDIEANFTQAEIVNMGIQKVCAKFFPERVSSSTRNGSEGQESNISGVQEG